MGARVIRANKLTSKMKTKTHLAVVLSLAMTLPAATIMIARAAIMERDAASIGRSGPCDIYAAAGTPCVAAHSTTRTLYSSYNGPLYQVTRQSDGATLDIGVVRPSPLDPGGYADAAAQDKFCANSLCVISRIYDQSGKNNHLYQAPPGTFKGPTQGGFNALPIADMAPVTIGGHKVYGVYIMPGMGFRNNNASGLAINDEPEGIYSVMDGTHYDSGCCFDYGNAETDSRADGPGTMETTYFGTATAWGSGEGPGPWIEADFEGGVFTGYSAKKNSGSPTIDSWRFITAVVDGGGGNKWDLRGGNAQAGQLTTFYSGVRPGSSNSANYFPMHKQGSVLLGNGGDNGNGSSGTFYEGVMTTGYPTEATTDAVQANIVAAKYDVQPVSLSRVKPFMPNSTQDATVTFKNVTATPVTNVKLSIALPSGWPAQIDGATVASKTFADAVAPGATVSATFKVTSPAKVSAGFLTGKAEWTGPAPAQMDTVEERVRNIVPVKINEVRLGNQFIELYNASESEVDLSGWTVTNTQSQSSPVKLATIPPGTKLAAHDFYLLGLSSSGLATPTVPGASNINVRSITGFQVGQKIDVDGETRTITTVGTPAAAPTSIFVPVSTGPWLTLPAGSTNLPVTSIAGFEPGQKIGIDIGGHFEIATVTAVGKAATQTTLSTATAAGATNLKVATAVNLSIGETLTVGTGQRKELVKVAGMTGSSVDLATPLQFEHVSGVNVSATGTGISFSPPTRFVHTSGEAIQALGTGLTLDSPLSKSHENGAPVVNSQAAAGAYQGPPEANQWFGSPLSTSAGSIALMDASGKVVIDAMVFGSRQSSSSANGTIASPELATLFGNQTQGGCIVVAPSSGRGAGRGAPATGATNRSMARTSDGADSGSLCSDFQLQTPTPGAPNNQTQ